MADPADPGHVTRDCPALFLRAEFTPRSVDAEARTAEVVFSTGARVLRGFWDPFWEELSLDPKHVRLGRLNNGAPLLDSHSSWDTSSVVGVVEAASVDGKRGTARVRFAKDEASDKVFQKVRDGILQNISVGYRVHKFETTEPGDPDAKKPPVRRAVDWEPYEISVVPMGADDGAGFRSAGRSEALNPCVLVTPNPKERQMNENQDKGGGATVTDPTEALLTQAREENARVALEADKAARAAADKAVVEAQARMTETLRLVRKTNLGDKFAEDLIKANTPIDKVREIVLKHLTEGQDPVDGHVRFEAGDDVREKFIRGASASIIERIGHAQMIEDAKQNKRLGHLLRDVATDAGEFRGMRLLDLARASLELRGVNTKGLHGERLVKAALEYRGDAGFNSTSDYTVLLESVVNKVFLGRYATIPVTWPIWCARKSVQDFRTSTFYRPGSLGTLDSVSENGEVKHKNIPDGAKATLTPATKGNIVGLTRKAIVNDDLGAFRDIASELGAAAARTIEADAWALITAASGLGANAPDGVALFNAAHSNIGSTGAMSVATLDSMRAKMALQKDPASNAYLAMRPAILLVPVELAGTAKVFNSSSADPTDSKNSNVANRVQGLFRDIVDSPHLSASSATRHYALADPNVGPVFGVGFIDGQEAPVITSEQSFPYDGVQMKVVLDYGVAVMDYRGAVTCAGA